MLQREVVDQVCAWWGNRLREHVTDFGGGLAMPEERIDRFCTELHAILSGDQTSPFGRVVQRRLMNGLPLDLYTHDEPQGIIAEAAMAAGFRKEFVMFPKHLHMRVLGTHFEILQ